MAFPFSSTADLSRTSLDIQILSLQLATRERLFRVEHRPPCKVHNRSPFVEEEIVMEALTSSGARRVP